MLIFSTILQRDWCDVLIHQAKPWLLWWGDHCFGVLCSVVVGGVGGFVIVVVEVVVVVVAIVEIDVGVAAGVGEA